MRPATGLVHRMESKPCRSWRRGAIVLSVARRVSHRDTDRWPRDLRQPPALESLAHRAGRQQRTHELRGTVDLADSRSAEAHAGCGSAPLRATDPRRTTPADPPRAARRRALPARRCSGSDAGASPAARRSTKARTSAALYRRRWPASMTGPGKSVRARSVQTVRRPRGSGGALKHRIGFGICLFKARASIHFPAPLCGKAYLAEGVGFEPTDTQCASPDFESGAFDHSATLPATDAAIVIVESRRRAF
jgi:hypothetical protein